MATRKIMLKLIMAEAFSDDYLGYIQNYKDDKQIMLAAIERDPFNFFDVSDRLRDDEDILTMAVKEKVHGSLLAHISDRLKGDYELMRKLANCNPLLMLYVPDHIKNDKDFVMTCVMRDAYLFIYASEELKDDKPFVIQCMKQAKISYYAISQRLQRDPDIVLLAVEGWEATSYQYGTLEAYLIAFQAGFKIEDPKHGLYDVFLDYQKLMLLRVQNKLCPDIIKRLKDVLIMKMGKVNRD